MARNIPLIYVQNSMDFYQRSLAERARNPVRLMEYNRPGWTFHAKGIWINWRNACGKHGSRRVATIIGSSNYGTSLFNFFQFTVGAF